MSLGDNEWELPPNLQLFFFSLRKVASLVRERCDISYFSMHSIARPLFVTADKMSKYNLHACVEWQRKNEFISQTKSHAHDSVGRCKRIRFFYQLHNVWLIRFFVHWFYEGFFSHANRREKNPPAEIADRHLFST